MEKEFVPYELAVKLKALGFSNSYSIGGYQGGAVFYYEEGKLYYDGRPMYSSDSHAGQIDAPLYQQAFRWFRDKFDLYSHVRESYSFDNTLEFVSQINGSYVNHGISDKPINRFDTYEEAELACLTKLIEIVEKELIKSE